MRNLHLLYNKLYYQSVNNLQDRCKALNQQIISVEFVPDRDRLSQFDHVPGLSCFSLEVVYPGLLIGLGALHSSGLSREEIKLGFTFDYVSGQPILPGSSLKGMLRSCFQEQPEMICGLLQLPMGDASKAASSLQQVNALKESIFDGGDVFFDAIVERGDPSGKVMEQDFITPHPSPFKNPIPIRMLKVRPGVRFTFRFLLSDSRMDDDCLLSAQDKLSLFRQLIPLMGVGAKTNVGYGHLQEIRQSGGVQ